MKKADDLNYTVSELCEAFDVPPSSYYYKHMKPSKQDSAMTQDIKIIFKHSGHTYGKRRIKAELNGLGYQVGLHKTKRLMKESGIVALTPRKRHYYPDCGFAHQYVPNILNRDFSPEKMNTHWAGDITYVRTYQGWSYLAAVIDLKTKEIVGYAVSTSPNAALVRRALIHAIKTKQPDTTKLLFHSDQGTQYAAQSFQYCLRVHGIKQSMSRRGNCWDNAVMERFFRSLKTERLHHVSLVSHLVASTCIEQYIYFYNYQRRHSTIGYITPHQMATKLKNVA